MTNYQTIAVHTAAPTLTIELRRPPLNIIDIAMMGEISDALTRAEAATGENVGVRFIVFRAAGEKAFCAGVSIQDHLPATIEKMIVDFHRIFRQLAKSDKIIIAAVQGHCLGGGLELVSMCDLVIATETAQFGQPEIKLGQMPPVGVILLPHLIGYRKAAELVLTGASIPAREALALGLVNRIVPAADLAKATEALLAELSGLSGEAMKLTKHLLHRTQGLNFEHLLDDSESFFLNRLAPTHDAKEGIVAFLEKRAPKWTHH
jgi:cyclohexa-1,5-dienecarbonyl-CoA hydratase